MVFKTKICPKIGVLRYKFVEISVFQLKICQNVVKCQILVSKGQDLL